MNRYVFGAFEADERRFELRRHGVVVPLQRRTLEVLFFFLKNRGVLLGKRELIRGPGGGTAVGDSALYRAVMLARRALENEDGTSFIATVRGKGYRFEGCVQELSAPSERPPAPAVAVSTAEATEPAKELQREPLLGRGEELGRLRGALETARNGRGVTVVISGPPGVGKSALVDAFLDEARTQNVQIAQARAWEGGGAPALLPWAEVARALARPTGDFSVEEWPPGFSDLLARLVPELDVSSAEQLEARAANQGAHVRFRLFEALARFLVNNAQANPLLLALEDLHSADDASLLMLQFLRRSMHSAPLLVIATVRDGEPVERACLRELLGACGDDLVQLPLRGLAAGDVGCLLERLHGAAPDVTQVERAYRLTEGNPLWVGELVRAGWLNRADPPDAAAPWRSVPVPERAVGWIAERMRRLPEDSQRLVRAAAVVGRAFSWHWLVQTLGLERTNSLSALRAALDAGLIQATPESAGEFRFPHAIVREAIYSGIAADQRYELHAQILAALASAASPNEARRVTQLAHHALAATPLLGTAPAIEYGLAAAERARQLCSYELAAWYSRRVLELLEFAPAEVSELRWQAWLALAEAEALSGRAASALESFEAMLTACRIAGQHEAFARAVLSCFEYAREIAITSSLFHARVWEALRLCQEPDALRARLLAVHSLLSYFYAPARDRVQQVEDAQRLARELDDPLTLLSVLRNGHFAAITPATQDRALQRVERMAELADHFAEPIARLEAHFWSAQHALDTGDGARFHSEVLAHARLAASIRHPVHLWYAALLQSVQALLAGELAVSAERARAAVPLGASAMGATSAESYAGGQLLALAFLHTGSARRALFDEVRSLGKRVLNVAPSFFAWRLAALVADFELHGATHVATEYAGMTASFDQIPDDAYWPLCMALLAHLARHRRDRAVLAALQDRLTPFQHLHVAVTSLYLGPVSFHLARIAEALGAPERARHWYQRAAQDALQCGALPWQRAAENALELR